MILKTVKAPTLKQARNKVRKDFKSVFIILESRAESASSPAQITIGIQQNLIKKPVSALPWHRHSGTEPDGNKPESNLTGSQSIGALLEPFKKQIRDLMTSGSDALKSFQSDKTHELGNEALPGIGSIGSQLGVHTSEGVSFERSSSKVKHIASSVKQTETSMQKQELPASEQNGFGQHFGKEVIKSLSRKVRTLEKLMVHLSPDDSSIYAAEPWYLTLKRAGFSSFFLQNWIEEASERPAFTRDEKHDPDTIKKYLFDRVDSHFTPRAMHDNHPLHIFSSLEGTDPLPLLLSVYHFNKKREINSRVAVLFTNSYESDEQGRLMLENLKFNNIKAEPVVSHRDWKGLLESRSSNEAILVLAIPVSISRVEIESRWDQFNRIFGVRHSIKHHLVAHALFQPEFLCSLLSERHPFSPDYISLTNFEMTGPILGNLTTYHEEAHCPFGYLHHISNTELGRYSLFDRQATSLLILDKQQNWHAEKIAG